jgi:hypothetical protein
VVNNIVRQVHAAGGRFLEKSTTFCYQRLWLPVSPTIARDKVSHALRDKFPPDSQGGVYCKIKSHIANVSLQCGIKIDFLYELITSHVLSIDLPRMEHASDNYVESILFQKATELLNSHVTIINKSKITDPDHSRCINPGSSYTSSISTNIKKNGNIALTDCMITMKELEFGNLESYANDQNEPIIMMPAICSTVPSNIFMGKDEDYQELESYLDHIFCNNDIHGQIVDRFFDIQTARWDLPESFSDKDCEDLIATLDNHALIADL